MTAYKTSLYLEFQVKSILQGLPSKNVIFAAGNDFTNIIDESTFSQRVPGVNSNPLEIFLTTNPEHYTFPLHRPIPICIISMLVFFQAE